MSHFCTCTDHACPLNPHNPGTENQGCDLCVRKCLKLGEIPSCFFNAICDSQRPEGGYTYRGFAEFVAKHLPGEES